LEKIRQENNWNIPNMLTVLRLLLLPVFAWRYLAGDMPWAWAVCGVVVVSDLLDGFLARRLKQITSFGKLIDPLADKLGLLTALVCFGARGKLPWWVIALVLGKEALMIAGGVYALRKQVVVAAKGIGKAATGLFALAVAGKLIDGGPPELHGAIDVLLYVAVAMAFAALAVYTRNFFRVMGERKNAESPAD